MDKSKRYFSRKLLRAIPRQITSILQAESLWQLGVTGKGVKVNKERYILESNKKMVLIKSWILLNIFYYLRLQYLTLD